MTTPSSCEVAPTIRGGGRLAMRKATAMLDQKTTSGTAYRFVVRAGSAGSAYRRGRECRDALTGCGSTSALPNGTHPPQPDRNADVVKPRDLAERMRHTRSWHSVLLQPIEHVPDGKGDRRANTGGPLQSGR